MGKLRSDWVNWIHPRYGYIKDKTCYICGTSPAKKCFNCGGDICPDHCFTNSSTTKGYCHMGCDWEKLNEVYSINQQLEFPSDIF